jgi:uncharacterized integral membrane protein (TIGR00697 family)
MTDKQNSSYLSDLGPIATAYAFLSALFAAVLIIGAALGSKIFIVFGVAVSVSALTYPITFLITDAVGDVFGHKYAQRIVYFGLAALLIFFALIQIALALPSAEFYRGTESYREIFGLSSRLILAGTIAYFVSQTFDVWFFSKIKRATAGRFLWLRNNLSTGLSQAIDTAIFVAIGFYGVAPLWELFLGQYLVKLCIAVIDTPFVYLARSWLQSLKLPR